MNPEKINFIKDFEDRNVRINEYVKIPDSTIKTLLHLDEQSEFLEIVESDSNIIRIKNISGIDLSYLYFVFSRVASMGIKFNPPVSDNNRLQISVYKNENNYNFSIFDSLSNTTHTLKNMSRENIMKIQYNFRAYKIYMLL